MNFMTEIICLANFLKTNLICCHLSEKVSKGMFLKPDKLQNHTDEGKAKPRKRDSEEEKGGEEKKSNGCTLNFYNGYFGDRFWPKKLNCWTQKDHLAIRFQKSGYSC